jgi:hypothetical protein
MQGVHHGCEKCDPMYNIRQKQDLIESVFSMGNRGPTMTLDEFADIEIKNMQKIEEQQKIAQAREQREAEKDQDKDEQTDKKTYKDREWDDWKDDHEKGAGNKKGR